MNIWLCHKLRHAQDSYLPCTIVNVAGTNKGNGGMWFKLGWWQMHKNNFSQPSAGGKKTNIKTVTAKVMFWKKQVIFDLWVWAVLSTVETWGESASAGEESFLPLDWPLAGCVVSSSLPHIHCISPRCRHDLFPTKLFLNSDSHLDWLQPLQQGKKSTTWMKKIKAVP